MRLALILLAGFITSAAAQQAQPVEIIGPDGRPAIATNRPLSDEPAGSGAATLWILACATALLASAGAGAWAWRAWARLPVEDRAFCLLSLRLGLSRPMRRRIERIAARAKVSPIAVAMSPGAIAHLAPSAGLAPEEIASLRRRLR